MRKKVLAVALVGLALPALALAAQPIRVRVAGRTVPVRALVRVIHTAAGPVRVKTWSWRGPQGTATVQVSESRGAGMVMPSWALAQMSALRAQMRQMQLIETALARPMQVPSLPLRVLFGQPLLLTGQAPPRAVRFVQPLIPLQVAPLPMHVILLLPAPAIPKVAPQAPKPQHHGHLV